MVQVRNDATSYEPSNDFEPLPAGDYDLMVVGSKENSKQTGIIFEFDVVGPTHSGRKLWCNIAQTSDSDTANRMGYELLSQLQLAAGKPVIHDTDELNDCIVSAKVAIQKKDPTRNDIRGFAPAEGSRPAQRRTQQQPANAAPPAQRPAAPAQRPAAAPWR